jgi:uncharacterized protein (TIGR00369 family)
MADGAAGGPADVRVETGPLDARLGIVVVAAGVDRVEATMPAAGNAQARGRPLGAASLVLGEFLGSWAAVLWAATLGRSAVGVDLNATHFGTAAPGPLTGVATPLHLGRRVTTHEVAVRDASGRLVTEVRITNLLVDRSEH